VLAILSKGAGFDYHFTKPAGSAARLRWWLNWQSDKKSGKRSCQPVIQGFVDACGVRRGMRPAITRPKGVFDGNQKSQLFWLFD
jgi:hypothetical protein